MSARGACILLTVGGFVLIAYGEHSAAITCAVGATIISTLRRGAA